MQSQTPKKLNNSELVKWLNAHNPGKVFTGNTVRDPISHGPTEVLYVDSYLPVKHLRVPAGYKFNSDLHTITPINGGQWDSFIIVSTPRPGLFASWVNKARIFFRI